MKKIKFICDSACDLTDELIKEAELGIIPFTIIDTENGNRELKEGIDVTPKIIYKMLENAKEIPATSQIPAGEIMEHYERAFSEGYSDVIIATINKTASGTYNNTILAKDFFFEEHPEALGKFNVHTIDTGTYSIGYGRPMHKAALMHKKGADLSEILDYLTDWFASVEIYFALFSLKIAKKSGRVGAAASIVGETLGIHPIIKIIDGEMKTYSKIRGDKGVIPTLINIMTERRALDGEILYLKGSLEDYAKTLEKEIKDVDKKAFWASAYAGGLVTINTGSQILGLGFRGKKRR